MYLRGTEVARDSVPAGKLCSSFRAEAFALRRALELVLENPAWLVSVLRIMSDSQSVLRCLDRGLSAQTSGSIIGIWNLLLQLNTPTHVVYVPAHCGIHGNEVADRIAG